MTTKQIIDLFKRFLIIFLICIPLIIVLSVCTSLSSAWVIVISVIVCGGLFILEEYIHYKVIKKRQLRREEKKKENK